MSHEFRQVPSKQCPHVFYHSLIIELNGRIPCINNTHYKQKLAVQMMINTFSEALLTQ